MSNNLVGVCTSILATIIITLVKVPYFIIKKFCEHISWQDKKGTDYIIVHSYRSDRKGNMLRDAIRFLANAYVLLVPCIFMIAVLGIVVILSQLAVVHIYMLILGVSGVLICILHMQKYLAKKKKVYKNISDVMVFIVLFLLFSFTILASWACQNENLYYYTTIIALMLFFICRRFFEIKFESQDCGTKIIRFVRCLLIAIVYMLFSKEQNINVISKSFVPWFSLCIFEYIYSFFDKKYLLPYTIKCTDKKYITCNNILQMKDKKVKFIIEDKRVCIIEKEEIDCIVYEMENSKRYRKNNQIRIMYITKDGKKHICDQYVYLGKDWIEFRKMNDTKTEAIILPANQINHICSGNKEEQYKISDIIGG